MSQALGICTVGSLTIRCHVHRIYQRGAHTFRIQACRDLASDLHASNGTLCTEAALTPAVVNTHVAADNTTLLATDEASSTLLRATYRALPHWYGQQGTEAQHTRDSTSGEALNSLGIRRKDCHGAETGHGENIPSIWNCLDNGLAARSCMGTLCCGWHSRSWLSSAWFRYASLNAIHLLQPTNEVYTTQILATACRLL